MRVPTRGTNQVADPEWARVNPPPQTHTHT